jgi:type IV secretory pathway VirB4 component
MKTDLLKKINLDKLKAIKGKIPSLKLPTAIKPTSQPAAASTTVQDMIAPSAIEVDFDNLKINNHFIRTLFVAGYPRYVSANWLAPLVNYDHSLDIALFIYPVESKTVLDDLRRKIAEMEAEIATDMERGRVADPATQAKLEDAQVMQEQLVKGAERFFQFGLYITIPAETPEELNEISRGVESTLASLMIIPKHATLQMEEGFKTTLPLCLDYLNITRNMDTTSLATTFPFASSELTANEGIMYGINEHNGSLIVFDRFTLENYNSVVFAKAGAGKSYLVKLEILRSLMFDAEIIVIDPENEYENLSRAVGGEYITFGFNSQAKVNPFDLSQVREEGENELNNKILSLHSLFKVIMGDLNATEEAILDRALMMTYQMKGITQDPASQTKEPPLMEDLYKVLIGMEDPQARLLADRIEKFVKGSFAGIFDRYSNIDIRNPFTVFSLRDLEATLRPIAMFVILDFIWTRVRKELKKRILVVDEAWFMMQTLDSANFLNSIAKRARKYYLGVTTITQDVEDFLKNDIGKAIVTNSSIQILMKQHSAAIDNVGKLFYLSEGEKQFLLACDVGEGLFFAGSNHVAMRAMASPQEHQLVTSKPQEILEQKKAQAVPPVGPAPLSPAPPSSPPSSPSLTTAPAAPFGSQPTMTATPATQRPTTTLPPRFKSEIIMENAQSPQPKPNS